MRALERQPYVEAHDWATRTDLVRAALRGALRRSPLEQEDAGGGASGSQLFRISGDARVGEALVRWRFVLKCPTTKARTGQQSGTDPRAWDYWKREWLAYQDPLLGSCREV